MPNWGLSDALIDTKPWGLERRLLLPDKTNTDPIHEAIYFNYIERRIIDSPAFQRLRRVRQLGTTHLVYPGATHTRFQHALGALKVVQDLFDALLDNPVSRRLGDDLMSEWRAGPEYTVKLAESLVLARLGALLHDFCHVPYGHTVEDDFELLTPHDKNTERFNFFWDTIDSEIREAVPPELRRELEILILSKLPEGPESRYPFVADLVGNTVCADLIDYLWRDYYFTGLPGRLGKRFLSYFFVTPSNTPDFPRRMALRIVKNGRLRADVITEVFKYLRYRYELGERVLQHHAKVAADVMVAKAISLWIDQRGPDKVETALRYHGDDGLLEHLASQGLSGASELAAAVRDRKLFKEIRCARGETTYLRRENLFRTWGKPNMRKAVEEKAAKAVGLSATWHILLSIPDPRMRLKAADVLVSAGPVITRLRTWDEAHGRRAADLYESHERLWSIQLFVHPSVSATDRDRVAAYVAEELSLTWDPPSTYEVTSPVLEQVVAELAREYRLDAIAQTELRMAAHRQTGSAGETFEALKSRMAGLLPEPRPVGKDAELAPPRQPEAAGGKRPNQGKLV